jgi:hypothetical protein
LFGTFDAAVAVVGAGGGARAVGRDQEACFGLRASAVFDIGDKDPVAVKAGDGTRAVGRAQGACFGLEASSAFGVCDVATVVVEAGDGARTVGRVQEDFFGFSAAFGVDDVAPVGVGAGDGVRPWALGRAQEVLFELEASAVFVAGESVVCSFPAGRTRGGAVFALATGSVAADSAALLATDRTQEGWLAPEDVVDDAGDLDNHAGSVVSAGDSASLFAAGRTQEGFCCLSAGDVVDATGEVDNHAGSVVSADASLFASGRTQDGFTAADVGDATGESVVSTGASLFSPGRTHGAFLTAGDVVDATGDVRKNGALNSAGFLSELEGDFSFSCRFFDCDSLFPELVAFNDRLEACCS